MFSSAYRLGARDPALTAATYGARLVGGLDEVLPVLVAGVSAGTPSPVEPDLHRMVSAGDVLGTEGRTYVVRADGDSMTGDGIVSGDALVVDVDAEPAIGDVVVAVVGGDLTVKRLCREGRRVVLAPSHPVYPCVEITEDVSVWGVVVSVVRSLRRP